MYLPLACVNFLNVKVHMQPVSMHISLRIFFIVNFELYWSKDGAMMRVLVSHQCNPVLSQFSDQFVWVEFVVCSLSSSKGSSLPMGTLVFHPREKSTFPNSNLSGIDHLLENQPWLVWLPLIVSIYFVFVNNKERINRKK